VHILESSIYHSIDTDITFIASTTDQATEIVQALTNAFPCLAVERLSHERTVLRPTAHRNLHVFVIPLSLHLFSLAQELWESPTGSMWRTLKVAFGLRLLAPHYELIAVADAEIGFVKHASMYDSLYWSPHPDCGREDCIFRAVGKCTDKRMRA
jgi:hypothetical protein